MNDKKSIYKNKNFMLLWSGQSVSQIGSRLYSLALMWYILEKTGSELAMGISILCFTLPTVIIGPIAGVFADRINKKKIIVITDLINGLLIIGLSYFIATGQISILGLYIVMAIAASVSAIFSPAMASSYPLIVDNENLPKANSLSQITGRLISILGPVLSGIMIAVMDMWILFLINGISYIISCISEAFITIPDIEASTKKESFLTQFKEGLIGVWTDKSLLYLVLSGGVVINFFLAPLSIYSALVSKALEVDSTGLGIIQSAIGIGALIGSFIVLAEWLKDQYKMTIIGLTLEGIALLCYGLFINSFYMIVLCMAVLGLGVAFASVGITTLYQLLIPKQQMGRIMSLVSTLCSISVPIGALVGSIMVARYDVGTVLIISGTVVSVAGISLITIKKNSEMDDCEDKTESHGLKNPKLKEVS